MRAIGRLSCGSGGKPLRDERSSTGSGSLEEDARSSMPRGVVRRSLARLSGRRARVGRLEVQDSAAYEWCVIGAPDASTRGAVVDKLVVRNAFLWHGQTRELAKLVETLGAVRTVDLSGWLATDTQLRALLQLLGEERLSVQELVFNQVPGALPLALHVAFGMAERLPGPDLGALPSFAPTADHANRLRAVSQWVELGATGTARDGRLCFQISLKQFQAAGGFVSLGWECKSGSPSNSRCWDLGMEAGTVTLEELAPEVVQTRVEGSATWTIRVRAPLPAELVNVDLFVGVDCARGEMVLLRGLSGLLVAGPVSVPRWAISQGISPFVMASRGTVFSVAGQSPNGWAVFRSADTRPQSSSLPRLLAKGAQPSSAGSSFAGLRKLKLQHSTLPSSRLTSLVVSHRERLQALDLSGTCLEAATLEALMFGLHNEDVHGLRSLALDNVGNIPAGALAELVRRGPRLSHLSVASAGLDEAAGRTLAPALAQSPRMTRLVMSRNPLCPGGAEAIVAALVERQKSFKTLHRIELVDLRFCHLTGGEMSRPLGELLEAGLDELLLGGNPGLALQASFWFALRESGVKSLDISQCRVDVGNPGAFGGALQMAPELETLALSGTSLVVPLLEELSALLSDETKYSGSLSSLDLGACQLPREANGPLTELLLAPSSTIETLCLSKANLADPVELVTGSDWSACKLRALDLASLPESAVEAEGAGPAISTWVSWAAKLPRLRKLNLSGTPVDPASQAHLVEAMVGGALRELRELDLAGNVQQTEAQVIQLLDMAVAHPTLEALRLQTSGPAGVFAELMDAVMAERDLAARRDALRAVVARPQPKKRRSSVRLSPRARRTEAVQLTLQGLRLASRHLKVLEHILLPDGVEAGPSLTLELDGTGLLRIEDQSGADVVLPFKTVVGSLEVSSRETVDLSLLSCVTGSLSLQRSTVKFGPGARLSVGEEATFKSVKVDHLPAMIICKSLLLDAVTPVAGAPSPLPLPAVMDCPVVDLVSSDVKFPGRPLRPTSVRRSRRRRSRPSAQAESGVVPVVKWNRLASLSIKKCRNIVRLPASLALDTLALADLEHFSFEALGGADTDLDLTVRDSLLLQNMPGIAGLPDGVDSLRELTAINCANLAALPGGLTVSEVLDLAELPLTNLPNGMGLGAAGTPATLFLSNMHRLEAVPELGIMEAVIIRNCGSLEGCVPAGFRVLEVNNSPGVARLGLAKAPSRVERLHLEALPALRDLSGASLDFDIDADVTIANCAQLLRLPDAPLAGDPLCLGVLDVQNCPALELPERLWVRRELFLENCPRVVSICCPLDLDVLSLVDLPALERVPHLNAPCVVEPTCPGRVRNQLVLEDLPSLRNLSLAHLATDDAYVTLSSVSCAALPDGFTARSLAVSDCGDLAALPEGMCLADGMSLASQPGITSVPASARIGRGLTVTDCPELTSIPPAIFTGEAVYIKVSGTKLEDSDLLDLREELVGRGIRPIVTTGRRRATLPRFLATSSPDSEDELDESEGSEYESWPDEKVTLEEALEHWVEVVEEAAPRTAKASAKVAARAAPDPGTDKKDGGGGKADPAEQQRDDTEEAAAGETPCCSGFPGLSIERLNQVVDGAWESKDKEYGRERLALFLEKLRGANEFERDESRLGLAERTLGVLETICTLTDETLRREMLTLLTDALDTCSDKPLWALNQAEVAVRLSQVREDEAGLKELGRALMRLDIVHKHAQELCDAIEGDDVSVFLFFEIKLSEELDLPLSARRMIYPLDLSEDGVEEKLQAARQQALALSEEDVAEWLVQWPEWARLQRSKSAKTIEYESLPSSQLGKRTSGSWVAFKGEQMKRPVFVAGVGPFEMTELLDQWVATGRDFHNGVWPDLEAFTAALTRP